jgi:hypothetical protein
MAYLVTNPDYAHSPFTGMTREHWLDSAQFLVDGVFQYIGGIDEPIVIPKQSEVTYPQPDDPPHRKKSEAFLLIRLQRKPMPIIKAR